MLISAIRKLVNSIRNKEELPGQRKESTIIPIHKKGDKADCNNYRGISLLSTSYADDVNLLRDNIDTIKKNIETLIDASMEVGLEIYVEKTKYMLSRQQNVGQNRDI
jgi:hypothetical protein